MKHLMLCLCLAFFGPSLHAQVVIDLPQVSYFLGSTFSLFSHGGQFYAVQHINAPVITLSENIRVSQQSENALVVTDQISRETHSFVLVQPSGTNEHEVQGIIAFTGRDYNQMLLTTGPDGSSWVLNTAYLSSIDSGDGIRALGCFCLPQHESDFPCVSGGEGASECRVNFHPNSRENGCQTSCALGYHACCNLH